MDSMACAIPPADGPVLEAILALVRQRTGLDFSRYRVATVRRRIQNRMSSLGIPTLAAYLRVLSGPEDEATLLAARMTIKVSRFYRNAPSFDLLRRVIVPELARRRGPVRMWSAGCGCGEEPYTLAMLLDEAGIDGTVDATDVDDGALAAVAAATYPASAASELPAELAARYLEPAGPGLVRVAAAARRRVRTSRHDVTSGAAPGSRFDLIACRNVLIYLQRELQERTLRSAHAALHPAGFLFLGEAEWPSPPLALAPVDRRARIFRPLPAQVP